MSAEQASTITNASSNSMSAAWKIGDSGVRYMFIEMQGFSWSEELTGQDGQVDREGTCLLKSRLFS
jgi:hypothetical protein